MILRLLLALPLLAWNFAFAQTSAPDNSFVRRAVEQWLQTQLKGLPGDVSYEIGNPSSQTQLAACSQLDISRPASALAWGRSYVTVRCLDVAGWRLNIPVHIRVSTDYYAAARPIPQGQTITADDVIAQKGDLSELPARIVMDLATAMGKVAATSIPAGAPLRTDMLRTMLIVRQGQTVKVVSRGNGFEVSNEGRALSNASEGQLAQVRMANGQIVSGMAKAGGVIDISY